MKKNNDKNGWMVVFILKRHCSPSEEELSKNIHILQLKHMEFLITK